MVAPFDLICAAVIVISALAGFKGGLYLEAITLGLTLIGALISAFLSIPLNIALIQIISNPLITTMISISVVMTLVYFLARVFIDFRFIRKFPELDAQLDYWGGGILAALKGYIISAMILYTFFFSGTLGEYAKIRNSIAYKLLLPVTHSMRATVWFKQVDDFLSEKLQRPIKNTSIRPMSVFDGTITDSAKQVIKLIEAKVKLDTEDKKILPEILDNFSKDQLQSLIKVINSQEVSGNYILPYIVKQYVAITKEKEIASTPDRDAWINKVATEFLSKSALTAQVTPNSKAANVATSSEATASNRSNLVSAPANLDNKEKGPDIIEKTTNEILENQNKIEDKVELDKIINSVVDSHELQATPSNKTAQPDIIETADTTPSEGVLNKIEEEITEYAVTLEESITAQIEPEKIEEILDNLSEDQATTQISAEDEIPEISASLEIPSASVDNKKNDQTTKENAN